MYLCAEYSSFIYKKTHDCRSNIDISLVKLKTMYSKRRNSKKLLKHDYNFITTPQ